MKGYGTAKPHYLFVIACYDFILEAAWGLHQPQSSDANNSLTRVAANAFNKAKCSSAQRWLYHTLR